MYQYWFVKTLRSLFSSCFGIGILCSCMKLHWTFPAILPQQATILVHLPPIWKWSEPKWLTVSIFADDVGGVPTKMISDRVVKHHMNCGSSFYAFVFKILSENQYQISKWIIDGVNFSPPSRFQRDFLDTSVTFKSHEHLTWPYLPPFSAFVSIMNFRR